jgi:hypothetical protein
MVNGSNDAFSARQRTKLSREKRPSHPDEERDGLVLYLTS